MSTNLSTVNERTSSLSKNGKRNLFLTALMAVLFLFINVVPASAHCDSYDGPTIKDGLKALETNNVNLILKWIDKDQEAEVVSLFHKTYSLKNGDPEIYSIVEKHFLETLVRLHRETEGAPFTGLKPAGSTSAIVQLSDNSLYNSNLDNLLSKLNGHINQVIQEKYRKASELHKTKDVSAELGREYVEAYVDYTHTVEALHDIIEHGAEHAH